MKEERFYELAGKMWVECMEIMRSKGQAYSGKEDKLGNFKRVAKKLGLSPKQVWYVYFAKHLDALSSYLKGEYVDSEPIKGRLQDLINYVLLLWGLIYEEAEIDLRSVKKYVGGIKCCKETPGDEERPEACDASEISYQVYRDVLGNKVVNKTPTLRIPQNKCYDEHWDEKIGK
jgi:hypothetical protein